MSEPIDVDSLASKLMKALGRERPPVSDAEEYGGHGPPRSIPYSRFHQELEARKAAQAELTELRGEVEQLSTGYTSKLAEIKEATAQQVNGLGQRHQEDIRLIDAGLNDQIGRQTLRTVWESLPSSTRGKSPVDYWASQLEAHQAHHADPENAPAPTVARPLTPYLPAVEAPAPKQDAPASSDPWGGPPTGPAPRQSVSIETVPVDQGMEAFIAGLQQMGS